MYFAILYWYNLWSGYPETFCNVLAEKKKKEWEENEIIYIYVSFKWIEPHSEPEKQL